MASDNYDDKGLLKSIQQHTVNSKFSFNEVLNNENDGWDQYDPLDIVTDQFGNDESADLVPMRSKEFSPKQLPAVSSKFEYSESLDENGWSESELLDVDIDVMNNEKNTRLIEYETINTIDKQMKTSTHNSNSEDNDHIINESNQSPSNSQVQNNLQQDISTDSKIDILSDFGSDNHDTSGILNLVTDDKSEDASTSIRYEKELSEKLINNQQQQQFDSSNRFIFNDSLQQEDCWDETEPLYTNIKNIHISTNSRQQDQSEDDDDDKVIKTNDANNDKHQLSLLDAIMDEDEERNNISNAYESNEIEKQMPKYDNANLKEDNQDDHNMDLLEQGLYDPSQLYHQHLSLLFDDATKLDNEVNELEQLKSSDKNITIDGTIEDIKLDSFESATENVNSDSDNKSININETVSKNSVTDNNKNSKLDKIEPKVKNDIKYIVDDDLTLNKLKPVAKSANEGNRK